MAKTRMIIPHGSWPRLMRQDLAAAYLDVSASKLKADAALGRLPSPSQNNPPRWDRVRLDEWLDRQQAMTIPQTAQDWLARMDG